MNQKYNEEEKLAVLARHINGESVAAIISATGIPRSTVYAWIKEAVNSQEKNKTVSLKNFRLLQNKIVRLEGIIEILKKVDCTAGDPLEIKLPILEALQDQYSVHMLCEALDVSRGTYYNYTLRGKHTHTWYAQRREELRIKIQQVSMTVIKSSVRQR